VTWGGNDGFTVIEQAILENYLRYSFDWDNITTTGKQIDRFKDFLIQHGVNWEGDLQFTKIDNAIFVTSTLNSLSVDDESSGATRQIYDKRSYVFVKNQKVNSMQIELDDNSRKAILSIDGNEVYEFIVKQENHKLKVYPNEEISLQSVMAVYRNLRENYEFILRYDEAGKFFIKEMELKRKCKTVYSKITHDFLTKENKWFTKYFSLTGLYHLFSNYGESIVRPTIIGAITVRLSTLFWFMQSRPTLEPHFFVNSSNSLLYNSTSNFVYLNQAGNFSHWLTGFQRSLADFLPLLSLPGDIKVGVMDYTIKIVGGALTFGLLIIALRRKFERKYTR
jgi:hypothetical protein